MRPTPRRRQPSKLLVGTCFILFGLMWMTAFYFLAFRTPLNDWLLAAQLSRSGIEGPAKVLAVRDYHIVGRVQASENVGRKSIYFVQYQYEAPGPDGSLRQFVQEDRSLLEGVKTLEPGAIVRIRYLRENPAIARRIDSYVMPGSMLGGLACILVFPLLIIAAGVATIRQHLRGRMRSPAQIAIERSEQEQLERMGMVAVVDESFAAQLRYLLKKNSPAARYIAEAGGEVYLSPDFLPDPADRTLLRDLLQHYAAGEKSDVLTIFELLGLLSAPEHERAELRREQEQWRLQARLQDERALGRSFPMFRLIRIAILIGVAAVLVYLFARPVPLSIVDVPARQAAGLRTLDGHTSSVWDVAFAPDGKLLASASADGTLRLWRVSDGATVRTLSGHTSYVFGVAFSPDGKRLASASDDKTVRLWRVSDGADLRTLTGHSASVVKVTFSPDGKLLASSSEDTTVRLWRASNGALVRVLRGHTGPLYEAAFSPDGATLATAAKDGTLRLWRVADGQPIHTLLAQERPITSVVFSRDGALLAAGSADKTVRVWRAADWKLLHTLSGPEHWVYDVAFAPDSRTLAAASYDGSTRVWRFGNDVELTTFFGTEGSNRPGMAGVAFAPDGHTLAGVGQNRRVFLWAID